MRDKRIKLIYFSLHGSKGNELVLSWTRIFSILASLFVVMLLLVGSSIALFTDFYKNYRIEELSQTNSVLVSQLHDLGGSVEQLQKRMHFLENENDDLRIFADMPRIDQDTRKVGVGGAVDIETRPHSAMLPQSLKRESAAIVQTLDQLERRMQLYKDERAEINRTLSERQAQLKHRPSIRPVQGGRVSDRYGYRIDPFTDVKRHHKGIDISLPMGSDIHASASGVVVKAKESFTEGKGFGREILIDHGNGIKSRYAHLSEILVDVGQKVDRWTVVGKVGNSGRSTAPHLHYEILVNNRQVDPENFILN